MYLCLTKEERAASTVVFSSFFAKMPRKKGVATSDLEKFLRNVENFFSNVRFFLSEVGEKNAETVPRNVKENLFAKVQI